jgi:hypothetical protein
MQLVEINLFVNFNAIRILVLETLRFHGGDDRDLYPIYRFSLLVFKWIFFLVFQELSGELWTSCSESWRINGNWPRTGTFFFLFLFSHYQVLLSVYYPVL